MQKAGWEVHGVEPDADARKLAEELTGQPISDTEGLFQLENAGVDVITMWHVLEHVDDLDAYLTQINALLKEVGYFIAAVPNHHSFDARLYKDHWAAYEDRKSTRLNSSH